MTERSRCHTRSCWPCLPTRQNSEAWIPRRVRHCALAVSIALVAAQSHAQVLSWKGPATGSQNLATLSQVAFTTPGTYTVTVSEAITVTFLGVGGGGGGNGYSGDGGGGGGGGARTTGTIVTLLPSKTYTLVVGAGGVIGSPAGAGGATSLTNTTDGVPLVRLGGGTGGARQTAGSGGIVTYGSGAIGGGQGGPGSGENSNNNAGYG